MTTLLICLAWSPRNRKSHILVRILCATCSQPILLSLALPLLTSLPLPLFDLFLLCPVYLAALSHDFMSHRSAEECSYAHRLFKAILFPTPKVRSTQYRTTVLFFLRKERAILTKQIGLFLSPPRSTNDRTKCKSFLTSTRAGIQNYFILLLPLTLPAHLPLTDVYAYRLAYLDGDGPKPKRYAKAMIIRGPEDIMFYKVGPLPLGNSPKVYE